MLYWKTDQLNSYEASCAGKKVAQQTSKKKGNLQVKIALTTLSEDSVCLSVKMRNVSGAALEASLHAHTCWPSTASSYCKMRKLLNKKT